MLCNPISEAGNMLSSRIQCIATSIKDDATVFKEDNICNSDSATEGCLSNLHGDAKRDGRKSVPLRERASVSVVFVSSDRHIVAVEFLSSSLLHQCALMAKCCGKGGNMGCGSYGSSIATSAAQDNSPPRPSARFTYWSHGNMPLVQNNVLKCSLLECAVPGQETIARASFFNIEL
ncbi:uncharacterized protein ARMOST_06087 [Armillaria ostoyae]|uniref:Uncharacterized protein n=1 Tax=Armillaria ostoyae TaxID=47428 RepID=A0A284R202_ARMOS|nr:uncharacterized protein ARMOST_06087 [Armillaria ostoyae]